MTIKHPGVLFNPVLVKERCCRAQSTELKRAIAKVLGDAIKDYKPRVLKVVDIGFAGVGNGHKEFTGDGEQAYAQALAYIVTGDIVYAENAMAIIDAWSTGCVKFKGANAPLEGAWGVCSLSRACEIIKYMYPKWRSDVGLRYEQFVKKLIMPHLRGDTEKYKLNWGFYNNWHTSIIEARLQFAILTDDEVEVKWCVDEYTKVLNVGIYPNFLTKDTARDSDHACFMLAGLVGVAELLYQQGINKFSEKLWRCIELHAEAYGGNTCVNKSEFPNIYGWLQPCGWEIARNHYVNRCGKRMPNTEALIRKHAPFGYALHWGYDTLTHGLESTQQK